MLCKATVTGYYSSRTREANKTYVCDGGFFFLCDPPGLSPRVVVMIFLLAPSLLYLRGLVTRLTRLGRKCDPNYRKIHLIKPLLFAAHERGRTDGRTDGHSRHIHALATKNVKSSCVVKSCWDDRLRPQEEIGNSYYAATAPGFDGF